jgi:two-component system, NtrC family, C4-dicarboxylate transport response regulator DctD
MDQAEVKILIVDDDDGMRETLAEFVEMMGPQVRTASDVPGAELALRSEVPPFDIVLADLKLPGGTGLDVLKAA